MTQSTRHGSGPPSPPKRRKQSFLHPQNTGAVWAYLPALLLVAFVLRAAVALSGDFHLHPDELMQYLEPAHRLVFGNGVVCWEYFYGARSWIIPGTIAGVLWLHALVGLDSPAYYIATVKLVFCTLSLLMPLGMYLFCRRHWSEHSARLALVLGVFWYEFVAFAHKPMTEFVATALMLVLLSIMPLHTSARGWRVGCADRDSAFSVCAADRDDPPRRGNPRTCQGMAGDDRRRRCWCLRPALSMQFPTRMTSTSAFRGNASTPIFSATTTRVWNSTAA